MTTPSRSLPAQPASIRLARLAGIASLLLGSVAGLHAAQQVDDEEFNAARAKDKDPRNMNDWRFGYAMLPSDANISMLDKDDNANPANYKRETNWDKTGRTSVMWMTPWSGLAEDGDFILGLELSTNHCLIDQSVSSPEIDVRSYQLTIHPGLAWLLDEHFHIELNPLAGIGQSQVDQSAAGSGSALYWEVGLRAAAYYTWPSGFQLGMQTGYLYGKTKGDISGFDTDIEVQGIMLGIQVGFRL